MSALLAKKPIFTRNLLCKVEIVYFKIYWMSKCKHTPDKPRQVGIMIEYNLFDSMLPDFSQKHNVFMAVDRDVLKKSFNDRQGSLFNLTGTTWGTNIPNGSQEITVRIPVLPRVKSFIEKIK